MRTTGVWNIISDGYDRKFPNLEISASQKYICVQIDLPYDRIHFHRQAERASTDCAWKTFCVCNFLSVASWTSVLFSFGCFSHFLFFAHSISLILFDEWPCHRRTLQMLRVRNCFRWYRCETTVTLQSGVLVFVMLVDSWSWLRLAADCPSLSFRDFQ